MHVEPPKNSLQTFKILNYFSDILKKFCLNLQISTETGTGLKTTKRQKNPNSTRFESAPVPETRNGRKWKGKRWQQQEQQQRKRTRGENPRKSEGSNLSH